MNVGFTLLVEGSCGVHVELKDMPEERVADMRFTLRTSESLTLKSRPGFVPRRPASFGAA